VVFAALSWSAPAPKDTGPKKISDHEEVAPAENAKGIGAVAARRKSTNNLKQIVLAMHNYESAFATLPMNILDNDGKPMLSWRVHLLPYLEQNALYEEFKLDQSWDSEHNIKLLEKMPKVFSSPRITVKTKGYTVYQGFQGKGALFEGGKVGITSIIDGTSQTISVVEASTAVPWTKPVDLPFDVTKDLPDFGKAYDGRPIAALCDGSVHLLNLKKIRAEDLKAAITIAGGEVLPENWLD
jgi:hypothetical protein